jgi:hypothetical protein
MKLPDIVVEPAEEEKKAASVKEEKKELIATEKEEKVVKTSSRPSTPASTRSTRKNQNGNTPRESSIKEQEEDLHRQGEEEEKMKISSPEPQSKKITKRGRSVTPKKEIDEELDQIIEEEGKSPAKKKKRSNSRAKDEEKEKREEEEEEREDGEIDENQSIPNSSRPGTPLPVFTAKINRSSLRSSSKSSLKFEDEEEDVEPTSIIQPDFKKNKSDDGKQWHWICSDCLTVKGKQLLQQEIQVWWLDDYCVYYGTVDAFDEISSSHRVLYQDEEWEFLDLSSQAFLISFNKVRKEE